MSEQEKPSVVEQEDGSAVVEGVAALTNAEGAPESGLPSDAVSRETLEASQESNNEPQETPEERAIIREKRKEERHLKREIVKQREISAKNQIAALTRRNEELALRLAAVENTSASFKVSQADKQVEDQQLQIEFIKRQLEDAVNQQNTAKQVELLESLTDAKVRLREVEALRRQQVNDLKNPTKEALPTPGKQEAQRLANEWHRRNEWYDPAGRDVDSRIAQVIDQSMTAEGWHPADPEFWEEFQDRLKERIPHRFGPRAPQRGPSPTRESVPSQTSKQQYYLSKERVQAIKEAGAWDDPVRRKRLADSYRKYDEERGL